MWNAGGRFMRFLNICIVINTSRALEYLVYFEKLRVYPESKEEP